ncbi:MAG: phosphotransferase family protein [Acidimicrobiales bacterium]
MAETAVKGINNDAVSLWLEANVAGARGPFNFEFLTGGHSNLTFKVTAADGRNLVLRRPPLGSVLATAHDMAREHRIISGVGNTAVPVPAALALCEDESVNDAPFYIMDYVDGAVLHDAEVAIAEMPDHNVRGALSRSVVEVLATLHLANPDDIGLGDLGRKEAYLDRQLKRWRGQWENSKTRELPDMERAYDLLVDAKPEQRYTGVVHGDYRLGNMLVDGSSGAVLAVLDWELCTLGDPMADLAGLMGYWHDPENPDAGGDNETTGLDGFLTREELAARYAEEMQIDLALVDYYRGFASWRLACIGEGVYARYLNGQQGTQDEELDLDEYRDSVARRVDTAAAFLGIA